MVIEALLEKSRRINRILQKTAGQHVDFKEVADVLKSVINANIYISDRNGKILGHSLVDEFECELMVDNVLKNNTFPPEYSSQLLSVDESKVNLRQKNNDCVFNDEIKCLFEEKITTIVPIMGGGKRLGTLLLARFSEEFTAQDLILAEYGATVIGMEILRTRADKIKRKQGIRLWSRWLSAPCLIRNLKQWKIFLPSLTAMKAYSSPAKLRTSLVLPGLS